MIYVLGHNQPQPEGYAAFIPEQFPPRDGFEFDQKTIQQAVEATWLIGKLDGATRQLPNIDFFQRMYLQKDAASSSQIEGTKATMVDSIIAGAFADELFDSDVNDIINYVNALEFGARVLAAGKLPLSLRFIRELHRALMEHGRKSQFADPGMFRKTQNWINGTGPSNAEYVPPTVTEMHRALGDLERFMHSQDLLPPIIKAGILHAQFELIHPFLDGNGRTGRMLVTFFLQHAGYLSYPVLYLSSYFKKYRDLYFQRLTDYRNGKIDQWLQFFLQGIAEISIEATTVMQRLIKLQNEDLQSIAAMGSRAAKLSMIVFQQLFAQPIVTVSVVKEWTNLNSEGGARKVIERLIACGILQRYTSINVPIIKNVGREPDLFEYKRYIRLFDEPIG